MIYFDSSYNAERRTTQCTDDIIKETNLIKRNNFECKRTDKESFKRNKRVVKNDKNKFPHTLTGTAVLKIRFPALNLFPQNEHEQSRFTLINSRKISKKKKMKNIRKSKSVSKSFTNSVNTDFEFKEHNNHSFKTVFSHNKHRNTSYRTNGFSQDGLENTQIFASNNHRKNHKKKRNSNSFTTDPISTNNFIEKIRGSPKRKRRNSDKSNNFIVNKKLKYNDRAKSSLNSTVNYLESNNLDISDERDDSEIFYFDISGNKNRSFAASSLNKILNQKNRTICQDVSKKNMEHEDVKTLVDIRDSDCEMSFSGVSFHKKKNKEIPIKDTVINQEDNRTKEKNGKIYNNHIELCTINKKTRGDNMIDFMKTNRELCIDISSSSESPKESKKHKEFETMVDIRDSDCEISVSDVSSCKKRREKKRPIENVVPNEEESSNYENASDDNKVDAEKTEKERSVDISSSFKKSKKKYENAETLVDIRNSDCEMSVSDISSRKKKKKKTKPIESVVLNEEGSTKGENASDDNKVYAERRRKEIIADILNSLKKSMKKCEDNRDQSLDCEIRFSDVSSRKKKKKKKRLIERVVIIDEESRYENASDDNKIYAKKTEKKINVDILSSLKKSKESYEDDETLIDIRDSDYKMSVSDVSFHKKKKKKKRPTESVVLNEEEIITDMLSNFKKPKKKYEDVETLVDIRDSDCEMSVSDVSSRKKKKKNMAVQSVVLNEEESTKYENALDDRKVHVKKIEKEIIADTLSSFKKPKKKYDVETLIDISDSDCEMSVSDALSPKKKKKKMRLMIESVVLNGEESTKYENASDDNKVYAERREKEIIADILSSLKKPKQKYEDIETLVDVRDSDCKMSVSDAVSPKKNKKKRRPIEVVVLNEEEGTKYENASDDIKVDAKKTKKERSSYILSGFKKSKKKYDVGTLVDIRDSDCEMSINDVSSHKKKKKKRPIEGVVLNEEGNTKCEIASDNNKVDAEKIGKKISADTLSSFKKPKKKYDVETLVDIRDSECEMSVGDALFPKKKKKKRRLMIESVVLNGEESTKYENASDDTKVYAEKTEKEKSEDTISGFKKSKKKCKDVDTLVDIRDSDCEMSFSHVSFPKKKKIFTDDEVSSQEKTTTKKKNRDNDIKDTIVNENNQEGSKIGINNTNKNKNIDMASNFKSQKKIKKRYNDSESLIDIRHSDCEMSFSDVSFHKKKKRKKMPKEGDVPNQEESTPKKKNRDIFNHIEHVSESTPEDNINTMKINMDSDIDMTNSFKLPNKLKKQHSDIESFVDIRDSDYEMSFSNVSFYKKNKRKMTSVENVEINQEENTCDRKTREIINKHIEPKNARASEDNRTDLEKFEKKSKEEHKEHIETMVDIKNSDFEMKNKDEEDLVDIGDIKFQVEVNISDFEVDIETETMPEQKSEKIVHLNCHDYKNSLPQIDETEMSPVSHFSENSSGNFSEHQQEFNDNIVIRDNKLARIECNNKLYNQVNISSSEGFVSDSSEIRSPLKKCKNGMNRRSIREKEIETIHCDNYNSVSSNKQSIDEDDFDIIEYENTSQISEDLGKIVAINKEVGYDLPEYTDDETSDDNPDISHETKKSNNAEIALKKSGYDLPEYTDDETSDDNLDISHETKKSNNAEIALKKSGVKDIIPNIRRQKTAKSVFAESFEKSDLIKKEPSTETSDILEISDMVQEEVNNDDIETVQRMSIVLPFPVPPLHSILTRTTTPSKEQLGEIKRQNLEVKTGPFSKEEDRMIIDNWKRFYKEHDLTVNPSLFIKFPRRMKLREKTDFLRYLAHGLDNRLLHRVHARFKHLVKMPHLKLGRFSPEEDEKLLNFINEAKLSNPFATLSKILQRPKGSLIKRYYLLTSKKNKKKVSWTLPMVDRLVMNMKNVTKCDKVKHLKHKKLTEREWKKLSKKMDNIPVRKLQRAWNVTIYPRLFAKSVNLKTMKEDIIHILYKRNETDWKTVNWKEIAENYKGFTPQKIYMMFKTLVNFHVPDTKRKNLAECLEYLEHILLKQSKISTPHRFKKFKCEQGHIVYKNESE